MFRRAATQNAEVSLILKLGATERQPLEPFVAHLIGQARCSFVQKVAFGGMSHAQGIDSFVDPTEGVGCGALLSALDRVTAPYVLVAYAPLVFHAARGSWVAEAIDRLERDAGLLCVTDQCGAAAGPAGSPRNRPKSRGPARWDGHLHLWRRRKIASPAFVASRDKLANALARVPSGIGDLESALTAALRASNADCGSLAGNDGWALGIEGKMSPEAAANLIALAEAGVFPASLLGKSSLSLDEPSLLASWQRMALEIGSEAQRV